MIKRVCGSITKFLAIVALPLLAILSSNANAGNIPESEGPCGTLTKLGGKEVYSHIYNNSLYKWNVVFTTHNYRDLVSINAGAVKYLYNGWWQDNGYGDYHASKIYTVPVLSGQAVKIAYCSDSSEGDYYLHGLVTFVLTDDYKNHGTPDGNVRFEGVNTIPTFFNHGTTPHVAYNKNPGGTWEVGSITICPNDPYCNIP
jgi:hypothetical protein